MARQTFSGKSNYDPDMFYPRTYTGSSGHHSKAGDFAAASRRQQMMMQEQMMQTQRYNTMRTEHLEAELVEQETQKQEEDIYYLLT